MAVYWAQYVLLNTIKYLLYLVDILIYTLHFSGILNDLWRGSEAKLLSATAPMADNRRPALPLAAVLKLASLPLFYCLTNCYNISTLPDMSILNLVI